MCLGSPPVTRVEPERGRVLWREFVRFCNSLQITYYLIRGGEILTSVLPMRVNYAVATAAGDALFYTWRVLRRQVSANVAQVLGEGASEREVSRVTRAVLRNYMKYLVDFVRLPSLAREKMERLVRMSGIEHLERALEAGKGVIFVGLHFGSFEIPGAMMALRGYPIHAVVETFQPEKLNALVQRRRADRGITLVPLETTTATRKLLRALQRNEILGLLIDRPSKDEGVVVRFCGGVTRVPGGAALLALKTGARLLPGYALRHPDDTFSGVILPHIEARRTGDMERDIQHLMQSAMTALEDSVQQHPEQWFMFREMWPRELADARLAATAEVLC